LTPELYTARNRQQTVYRASDELAHEEWLARLDRAADRLALESEARSRAADLFLSTMPEPDRSKPAAMATALYVGSLVAGDRRSQTAVAEATGVSRLTVQGRWKELMETAGLEPPGW
jgi:transcription initiation factor TFIIIB Brf1 subunit/transcription initiation factor TFIIB